MNVFEQEDTIMTVPVWVEQSNGKFTATIIGATKEQAIGAVTAQLRSRMTAGEVVLVDLQVPLPFSEVSPEEATAWRELSEEIYRERDAQKAAEWPE